MSLKLFLVNTHPTFLTAAQNFLSMFPDVEILGHAFNGHDALQQAELLQPNVVLMDIDLHGMGAIEVANSMNRWAMPPRIVLLTMNDCAEYRVLFENVHAFAFVNKADFVLELMPIMDGLISWKSEQEKSCH